MAEAGLALINLEDQGAFTFQYFPNSLRTQNRANWNAQDTTIGIKPLYYANREPRRIEFPELYFDNTDTNESLTETIKELQALMEETDKGTPPALLAAWGDRHERCVLEELAIEEKLFNPSGEPILIVCRLSLLQLQPDSGESTGVQVGE